MSDRYSKLIEAMANMPLDPSTVSFEDIGMGKARGLTKVRIKESSLASNDKMFKNALSVLARDKSQTERQKRNAEIEVQNLKEELKKIAKRSQAPAKKETARHYVGCHPGRGKHRK